MGTSHAIGSRTPEVFGKVKRDRTDRQDQNYVSYQHALILIHFDGTSYHFL